MNPLVILGAAVGVLWLLNRQGVGAWSREAIPVGTRGGAGAAPPGASTSDYLRAAAAEASMDQFLLGSASPHAAVDVPALPTLDLTPPDLTGPDTSNVTFAKAPGLVPNFDQAIYWDLNSTDLRGPDTSSGY